MFAKTTARAVRATVDSTGVKAAVMFLTWRGDEGEEINSRRCVCVCVCVCVCDDYQCVDLSVKPAESCSGLDVLFLRFSFIRPERDSLFD